jgi:trimeric autotransporter adhesin
MQPKRYAMGSAMQRFLGHHPLVVSTFAALIIGLSGPSVAPAQIVMSPSAPADCVQNAGNGELACGLGATASPGTGTTAIGINSKATADGAVAFGSNANASSISAMAFGLNTTASNQGSVAVGQGATASGSASTALGFAARAFGNESVAVGDTASAGSPNVHFSTAIGSNTSANFASSTAIGFGAQTTAANQMMLGTATSIYALPGVNSAASQGAQKAPLMMLTVDADGNVAAAAIPTCRCPPAPTPPSRPSRPPRKK